MSELWPWLAIAGLGAAHGLSPVNGWMFAAARGAQTGDSRQAWRALLPIGIGHAVSIALVAYVFSLGVSMERSRIHAAAGALLVGVAAYRWLAGTRQRTPAGTHASHAGIALWSFLMATAHGAGLMLVPALVPLCLANDPARAITASGSLALALAVVGVHMAAMLVMTGIAAAGACRGIAMHRRWSRAAMPGQIWTAILAITGVLLIVLR
ncbi:hypothetical protein [Pseudoxanthomonas wuyuanensis]|uniref:Threonine/homoserine/homoserine lactone efflux protein n=1 Tax=Pseudoxanthomonas wuyuanensis TaxID=1073196 RepID=A0A286D2Q9_9GAMM|nr:hypothetical protein [Pseudoxanthomonas wuyuanensis]KAF1723071.1 hypothetical protein CSC75_00880 [Pseudoxanthomonas wuyuanensis]SOD52943.1 hypothetical protein SAMN06296416_102159 [Pseudoxanthomonas wuyuanensis]